MDGILTDAERPRYEATLAALFATTRADEEGWGTAVAAALKALVDASAAMVVLQRGRASRAYGDALPDALLRRYLAPPAAGPRDGAAAAEGGAAARIWCKSDRVERVAAVASVDTVGEGTYEAVGFTTEFGVPGTYARVACHHDPGRDHAETRRHVALLSLLLPAFTVAARARVLAPPRHVLTRLLDTVGAPALLCSPAGEFFHANAPLARLLAAEPSGTVLRAEIRRAVRAVADAGGEMVTHDARVGAARFRLRCSLLTDAAPAAAASVVVTVERAEGAGLGAEVLRDRFGLTERETEVTRLLAGGQSNATIAQALGISPCTARHHTERVLAKLGAHSRAEVPAILHSDAQATGA